MPNFCVTVVRFCTDVLSDLKFLIRVDRADEHSLYYCSSVSRPSAHTQSLPRS